MATAWPVQPMITGCGVFEQSDPEHETLFDQEGGVVPAGPHDVEVEAAGKDARTTVEDDDGPVGVGPIEGLTNGGEHGEGQGVRLAVT